MHLGGSTVIHGMDKAACINSGGIPSSCANTGYGPANVCTCTYIQADASPAPAPALAPAQITVSPTISTQVSPQISPNFQQQFQPSNSPMTAGTTQSTNPQTSVPSSGLTQGDIDAALERQQALFLKAMQSAGVTGQNQSAPPPIATVPAMVPATSSYEQLPAAPMPAAIGPSMDAPSSTDVLPEASPAPKSNWTVPAIIGAIALLIFSGDRKNARR